jgi:hypothetical protein
VHRKLRGSLLIIGGSSPSSTRGAGGRVSGTRCTKSGFGLYTECDFSLHFQLLQHEVEILNGKLSKNSPKLLQNPICIIMLSRISMTPSRQGSPLLPCTIITVQPDTAILQPLVRRAYASLLMLRVRIPRNIIVKIYRSSI